ncbi:ErpL protein [Bacillus cereus]|nr:ErpL protein [Bacillus cereus]PGU70814.1 ErpL protein [Bacillus cereus]
MGEIKMLKRPRNLKKMLILPCMCSITFYLGSQIMTHTEAAFIHETKVEGAISAAIIFPKTVNTLKEQGEQHKQFIEDEYRTMKGKLAATSIEEIEQAISVWQQGREKIASEKEALQNVYTAIETPYNQIQEELKVNKSESIQQVALYVNEGFRSIKEKRDYIEKEVDLQAIDEQVHVFQQQLKDAIEAEAQKKGEKQKKEEEQKKAEEQKKIEEQKQVETVKKPEQVEHEKVPSTNKEKQLKNKIVESEKEPAQAGNSHEKE